jgi:hypothetical protein
VGKLVCLVYDKWSCYRMKQTTRRRHKICGNIDAVKTHSLNHDRFSNRAYVKQFSPFPQKYTCPRV